VSELNRYSKIIGWIFGKYYEEGCRSVSFSRDDLREAAEDMKIRLPKNLGDVIYSFRYRTALPTSVQALAPKGEQWIIRAAGRGRYRFVSAGMVSIDPNSSLARTKVPDATPGIIGKYALSDEQALLAKIRYNRLLDIFTSVTCYSLQNHLRTTVPGMGQVETDEIYVGIDRRGAQYAFPVEAKAGRDSLSVVQIEQNLAVCEDKFPSLICRPIAAQLMDEDTIALFELEMADDGIRVSVEKHYQLVPPEEISDEDLRTYSSRPLE